jgi:hypothetical protein
MLADQACISAARRSRSSPLSFTIYFFTAICFAVTKHLRRCGVINSEIHRDEILGAPDVLENRE